MKTFWNSCRKWRKTAYETKRILAQQLVILHNISASDKRLKSSFCKRLRLQTNARLDRTYQQRAVPHLQHFTESFYAKSRAVKSP